MAEQTNFEGLVSAFEDAFGDDVERDLLAVCAPGRTEIAGNHTDHEGGCVIAAAVDRYVEGVFSANDDGVMRVKSEGYGLVEVPVASTDALEEERGTTASLVRGMAAQFKERGFEPHGFDACIRSDVLGGSGLSSSAAFELELGQAMNSLWAYGAIAPEELALMAQRAEREWFGKPCGLMDQAAVALGGVQYMDFQDPTKLKAEALDFDFADHGYAICLVAVGASHEDLTDEYAAVPGEMQAVARIFGKERLRDLDPLDMDQVAELLPRIRAELGDRAVLRSVHYFFESGLVEERREAMLEGDMDAFLFATQRSGMSSAMLLQNVSVAGSKEQQAMVALATAEYILQGKGASRIHGGGFGGTIQAFVPEDMVERFVTGMDLVFGEGSSGIYNVDHEGARSWWM